MNVEQEDALADLAIKNALYIQALVKLLIKKGIITEEELEQEYAFIKMEFETEDSAKVN